ncbi:MAG: 30S ribosomal protein S4e [Candidatus ainarchaeum sp.]|nr:30S ribosomal protein S4e [Candidatus ainarchaeum sp.]
MAKRGQKKHVKRIAIPKAVAIRNKKEHVWVTKSKPGPHNHKHAIPLSVLLRDILQMCKTNREAKTIINNRAVFIDGKVRTEEKFPVGFMDVVHFNGEDKYYRILVEKHGRLIPAEINADEGKEKIAKVVKKFTYKKNIIMITLHDGKTIKADNNVKVGDSVVVSLPDNSIKKILRMDKGARCLIKGGKHSGTIAVIEEIMQKGTREKEARMKTKEGEFTTVTEHLCVVDDRIRGA